MFKNYKKVLDRVLDDIRPNSIEKNRLEFLSKKVLEIANNEAAKYKARPILAGSITRDTWLPTKKEFDIFIIFPKTFSLGKLEKVGLNIGKTLIKKLKGDWIIEYAQHPYVRGRVFGTEVDIVPCYKKDPGEKIKSAVDRTPFHVEYLDKNFPRKLADDVRLLKQFCGANKIYGADAKTEGFSGYVCELLVMHYGGFINVLKNAVKWKPGEVIDLEKFYKKEDYRQLRREFKRQALILIDPTDKTRNAGAAISAHSFFILKKRAMEFLKTPTKEAFFEKRFEPMNENDLILVQMKRRTELLLVVFEPPKVVPDILWPQLRRFAERLESMLKEDEFTVLRKDIYTNEKDVVVIVLEMEISKSPYINKKIGPLVFDLDDSKRFTEKYKKAALNGPFVENDFWSAEVERRFTTAREKLVDSLSEKEKVLKEKGVPNFVAEKISKKFDVICENDNIMNLIKKDDSFGIFLRRYFEKESLV